MSSIFKTKMLIYQSKANLDEKIFFSKIKHLQDPTTIKVLVRGLYGNRKIPHSFLVHGLCGIDFYIASLRC